MNSNSKGFAQFLVILAGSLVIILLIVTFAFKNGQIKLTSQGSISPTPSNQVINDVWKDWETYKTNVCTESVVTFKYPSNIKVQPSTLGNRLSLFWDGSDLLIGIGISYIPNSQLDSYEYKSIKSLLRLDVGNSTTTFQTGDWKEIFTRKPNEDIGEEIHQLDQFIRCEKGQGKAVLDGVEHNISDGFVVIIPAGTKHNIINTSSENQLKLYTVYSPPNHLDDTIHKTKIDAEADEQEHFNGITTE